MNDVHLLLFLGGKELFEQKIWVFANQQIRELAELHFSFLPILILAH